jgi:hypothetical protein
MTVKKINKKMFQNGHADAMAIQLHKITGYPLGMWRGVVPMFGRAFSIVDVHPCVIKGDSWIDVSGLNNGLPTSIKYNEQITKLELVEVSEQDVWRTYDIRDQKEFLKAANEYIHEDITLSLLLNLG